MSHDQFATKLSALVAVETASAHGDPERLAHVVERLAASLGFAIAITARGHGPTIDRLMAGAEGYAHAEAVDKAPFAKLMDKAGRP